jgi:hypothetical protein
MMHPQCWGVNTISVADGGIELIAVGLLISSVGDAAGGAVSVGGAPVGGNTVSFGTSVLVAAGVRVF